MTKIAVHHEHLGELVQCHASGCTISDVNGKPFASCEYTPQQYEEFMDTVGGALAKILGLKYKGREDHGDGVELVFQGSEGHGLTHWLNPAPAPRRTSKK